MTTQPSPQFISNHFIRDIVSKHHPREKAYNFFYKLIDALYGQEISLDPYQPQEIHLALTADSHAMKVMFVTMEPLSEAFVEYRMEAAGSADWQRSTAAQYSYTVQQKWWPIFTGVIYEADMTRLPLPSTKYRYRVGGYDSANATVRYSEEFVFSTAPLSTRPDQTVRIAMLADHGTFELLGFQTVNHMVNQSDNFDVIHVVGDLSYAGLSSAVPALNITSEDEFEHIWDLYGIQNQRLSAVKPFMVTNGNHERFYNWTAYTNRYKMPSSTNGAASDGNFWYSYDYGNVHMVSISSEHDLAVGSPQLTFLIKDLQQANANRANVPWIVVNIHKPVYSSVEGAPSYRAALESYLIQYDVDMCFFGHMHAYERISPVNNFEVSSAPVKLHGDARGLDAYYSTGKGPVYVCQGNTGAMQAERWVQPQPEWSAVRMANGLLARNRTSRATAELNSDSSLGADLYNYQNTYGYGVLTTVNATHLLYESVPNTEAERFYDRFWIIKRV